MSQVFLLSSPCSKEPLANTPFQMPHTQNLSGFPQITHLITCTAQRISFSFYHKVLLNNQSSCGIQLGFLTACSFQDVPRVVEYTGAPGTSPPRAVQFRNIFGAAVGLQAACLLLVVRYESRSLYVPMRKADTYML